MLPEIYITLMKYVLVFGFAGILSAIAGYWWRAKWWKNIIGIAIQIERLCLILVWAIVSVSVIWNLNRYNSEIVAWVELGLLGLEGIAHFFLFGVFEFTHQRTIRDMNIPLPDTRWHRFWDKVTRRKSNG